MPQIACLGILVADTVGRAIDALPPRGTLALIDQIELHTGGCAANTATALARLGVAAGILGKVGRDGFGDFVAQTLARAGVETTGLVRDESVSTSATMVAVHSDAQRSFLHVAGANAAFGVDDVRWDALAGASILHIAGPQLMPRLEGDGLAAILREAKQRGLTTTLDTVMNPRSSGWDGIAASVPYLDWLIPSHEEATLLTGETDPHEIARVLRGRGVRNIALKLGADGSLALPHGGDFLPAPALPAVAIDTLGAGDAWAAGFLIGLLHGWPLHQTLAVANAAGACCVEALGATAGVRSLGETLARAGYFTT